MSTKELINVIAEQVDLPKTKIEAVIDLFAEKLVQDLETQGEAKIHNVGSFVVRPTKGKKGRNPKTGEIINIPAGKRVSYRASTHLKNAVRKK